MSRAGDRDQTRTQAGTVVYYRQWPADRVSDIDDDGTVRPMNAAELDEWDAAELQDVDAAAVSALFGPSTKVPLRALRDKLTPTDNADTTTLGNDLALAVLRIIRELERMQGVDPS